MSRKTILLFTILCAVLTNSASLFAQDREGVEMVGRIYNHWLTTYDIVVQGDYAYVAAGHSGLQIVDISDPERLEVVGYYDDNPSYVYSVFVSGDYAYLTDPGEIGRNADTYGELLVIDISDPTNPYEVGACEGVEEYQAVDVFVSGNCAYLAEWHRVIAGPGGLRVIDVSDPTNPEEVFFQPSDGAFNEVFASGDCLYVAMAGYHQECFGLLVFDISDPVNPEQVGADIRDRNGAFDVFVSGDYAYVLFFDGLHIFDVSDPENPEDIGYYADWNFNDIFVSGNRAYLVGYDWDEVRGFFQVIDVSDLANPEDVALYDKEDYSARSVFISGDYAYFVGVDLNSYHNYHEFLRGTLGVVDVSDPSNPEELNVYETGGNINDVFVSGNYAYIADGYSGLRIVDISDPANPEEVSICNEVGFVKAVFVSGEYAYVSETSDVENGGCFHVIDIADPSSPEVTGTCETDDFSCSIFVSGDYAYLANYDIDAGRGIDRGSLRVIDISDQENPEEIDTYYVGDEFYDVFVSDDYAYATTHYVENHRGLYGLRIFDITDPTDLEEVGLFNTGKIAGVFVAGEYAFLAVSELHPGPAAVNDGLRIVDVSDPANPEEVGSCLTPGFTSDVFVVDDYAIMTDGWEGGIRVIDVSDPEHPVEVGFYNTPGDAKRLKVTDDGLIYVADLTNMGIYDASMAISGMREPTVSFMEGWNLISINVSPLQEFYSEDEDRGPNIIRMMAQLRIDEENHHIHLMKNEVGQFYAPEHDFINIPYWNLTEGYQVKVDENVEAVWSGEPIPPDTDIPLEDGWNIIAYFPTYELDASAPDFYVLSPIIDQLLIAKNREGHFMSPEWNFSNMPPWRETQGYQVKVDEDVVLNYPEEEEIDNCQLSIVNYQLVSTFENMSVLVTSVKGVRIIEGDQIVAFSSDGRMTGAGMIDTDGRCGLVVWGDDPSTDVIDGLQKGELFELRLWDASREIEVGLFAGTVHRGNGLVYDPDGFIALDVVAETTIPENFYVSQNYPNPFNSVTRISYGLPEAARVSIRIYNLAGRLVATVVDGEYPAGDYNVVWNAEFNTSGIYIVRMETEILTYSVKVVLIR